MERLDNNDKVVSLGKKPDGSLIQDEFGELRDLVGQHLQFLANASYSHDGTDHAFQDCVQMMSERALNSFNDCMSNMAQKFHGLEFEPLAIRGPQLAPTVRDEQGSE